MPCILSTSSLCEPTVKVVAPVVLLPWDSFALRLPPLLSHSTTWPPGVLIVTVLKSYDHLSKPSDGYFEIEVGVPCILSTSSL